MLPVVDSSSEPEDNQEPDLANIPGMTYRRELNNDSKLLYCSPYAEDLFGYSPDELLEEPQMPFSRLIYPGDRERVHREIRDSLNQDDTYHIKYRMLHRNKQLVLVVDRGKVVRAEGEDGSPDSGTPKILEGIITPVSPEGVNFKRPTDTDGELKTGTSATKYDVLTNLPNRHWFLEKIDAKLQSGSGTPSKTGRYALALLDLDDFQRLNDLHGRDVGDEIIKEFGNLLNDRIGDYGLVGRVSGDRFGLFLSREDIGDVEAFLRKQFDPFLTDYSFEEFDVEQEFSLGIAKYPEHADTLEDLVTSANRALERVKRKVNQSITVFKRADRDSFQAKHDAQERIEKALDEEKVEVHYQPIKDGTDETNVMHEALVRFNTQFKERGAGESIQKIIDESTLSQRIDRWVIETSIKDFSDKIGTDDFPFLAVNMFPSTIVNPGTFPEVNDLLDSYDFPAEKIVFEIPETLMLSHRDEATQNIKKAAEKYDFKFALDDFGVGHGSFRSLNTLPISFLKIDGTFVQDLTNSTVEQKFVEMTAGLSKQMNLQIIGEWIETQKTADLLMDLGVSLHQGYYYSHPVPMNKLENRYSA